MKTLKIGIENMKVFKEFKEFEIKPITVLTGENNVGKSVLPKLLYLLTQNKLLLTDNDRCDELYFDTKTLKLVGTFKDILCNKSQSSTLILKINSLKIEFKEFESSHGIKSVGIDKLSYIINNNEVASIIRRSDIRDEERDAIWDKLPDEIRNVYRTQAEIDMFGEEESPRDKFYNIQSYYYYQISDKLTEIIYEKLLKSKERFVISKKGQYIDGVFSQKAEIQKHNYVKDGGLINIKLMGSLDNPINIFSDKSDSSDMKEIRALLAEYDIFTKDELIREYINYEKEIIKEVFEIMEHLSMYYLWDHSLKKALYNDHEMEYWFSNWDTTNKIHSILTNKVYLKYLNINGSKAELEKKNITNFAKSVFKLIQNLFKEDFTVFNKLKNQYTFIKADTIRSNEYIFSTLKPEEEIFRDFYELKDAYRYEYVNKWIEKLKLGKKLLIEPIRFGDQPDVKGVAYSILTLDDHKIGLTQCGLGVLNILQLIIKTALISKVENAGNEKFVIVEEPESNLHPNLQSLLADFFCESHKKFGVFFIIETHSEYLVRKLQGIVANKTYDITNNDMSIKYLYHPDRIPKGHQQVEEMIMREDGVFENGFGKGFFDEAFNLTIELMGKKDS